MHRVGLSNGINLSQATKPSKGKEPEWRPIQQSSELTSVALPSSSIADKISDKQSQIDLDSFLQNIQIEEFARSVGISLDALSKENRVEVGSAPNPRLNLQEALPKCKVTLYERIMEFRTVNWFSHRRSTDDRLLKELKNSRREYIAEIMCFKESRGEQLDMKALQEKSNDFLRRLKQCNDRGMSHDHNTFLLEGNL